MRVAPFSAFFLYQCYPRVSALGFHSQSAFLKPRVLVFSETARLVWSWAPLGKFACISTLNSTSAFEYQSRFSGTSSLLSKMVWCPHGNCATGCCTIADL